MRKKSKAGDQGWATLVLEEPTETDQSIQVGPPSFLGRALRWAVIIGYGSDILIMAIGFGTGIKLPEWPIAGGSYIWNLMFGGPKHSLTWVLSVVALNGMIYSLVVFAIEIAAMLWRRR